MSLKQDGSTQENSICPAEGEHCTGSDRACIGVLAFCVDTLSIFMHRCVQLDSDRGPFLVLWHWLARNVGNIGGHDRDRGQASRKVVTFLVDGVQFERRFHIVVERSFR